MKLYFKIVLGLLVCIFTTGLQSCGKSDEDLKTNGYQRSDLIGSWKTKFDSEICYMILKSNGNGRLVYQDINTELTDEESIAWFYKDEVFTILDSEGTQNYSVSVLSEKLMVLINEDNETITFTRVNGSEVPGGNSDDWEDPDEPLNPGNSGNSLIQTKSVVPRAYSATVYGQYSGSKMPTSLGVEYSYDSNFPPNQSRTISIEGCFGGFEIEIIGLVDLAKVYYRVYAIVDNKTIYGPTKSFETLQGTYSIDGKTYKFIKVTGLATGSFSMMQTELPPSAELVIDGKTVGCLDIISPNSNRIMAGETRAFMEKFANAAVLPRYPTPQEWLFAASGGLLSKGFKYCGSNDIEDVAWFADNSNGHARKPAQKKANELGFYDMSGNYAELCAVFDEEQLEEIRDKYIKKFISSIKDVTAKYFDTNWAARGGAFGGNWNSPALKCQSNSSILYDTPRNTNEYDGASYTVRFVYSRPD